ELPLLPGASLPYPHPPGRVAADPSVAAPAPGHHSPAPRPVVTRRNRNWPPAEALRQQARKREHAHLHGIEVLPHLPGAGWLRNPARRLVLKLDQLSMHIIAGTAVNVGALEGSGRCADIRRAGPPAILPLPDAAFVIRSAFGHHAASSSRRATMSSTALAGMRRHRPTRKEASSRDRISS